MRKSFYYRILPLFLLTLLALCMCGCKTRYVAVPEIHYRDSVRTRLMRDSVFVHDSVFVSLLSHGDTVYLTKSVTKWRDRIRTDTVLAEVRDTVTKAVVRTVERDLTVYQSLAARWFGTLVAVLAALLLWVFRKPVLALARRLL